MNGTTMTMVAKQSIGTSDLSVRPLAFGGNVFGWTADEATSHEILDSFTAGGGDFIDTADQYAQWHPGNSGGESETIIGSWLASRKNRDSVVIATKVAKHNENRGLAPATIRRALEGSLKRLGTDHVDLYYAHEPDEHTPMIESIATFSALVDEGKVRALALSNFSGEQIRQWCEIARRENLHAPVALQPHYNLVERDYETNGMREAAEAEGLGVMPYYSLASGFLTGKYRESELAPTAGASPRAGAAMEYLDARGRAVLRVLDDISTAKQVSVTAVALAWLRQQPTIVAPIASARNTDQLPGLLQSLRTELSADEIDALTRASA